MVCIRLGRASYSGNTQAFQACATGSIPVARSMFKIKYYRQVTVAYLAYSDHFFRGT